MKKTTKLIALLLSALTLIICLAACDNKVDASGLWENATYTSDTTLGNGEKTVKVEIVAGDRSVTLTVKTNKTTLGDALFEHSIINDPSFFNTCNGILADWNRDQAYWSFVVDGKEALYGINDEKADVRSDAEYKIVYKK